jgi:hypothetical protein
MRLLQIGDQPVIEENVDPWNPALLDVFSPPVFLKHRVSFMQFDRLIGAGILQ